MEPKYRVNISHELEEFIKYPKNPRLPKYVRRLIKTSR